MSNKQLKLFTLPLNWLTSLLKLPFPSSSCSSSSFSDSSDLSYGRERQPCLPWCSCEGCFSSHKILQQPWGKAWDSVQPSLNAESLPWVISHSQWCEDWELPVTGSGCFCRCFAVLGVKTLFILRWIQFRTQSGEYTEACFWSKTSWGHKITCAKDNYPFNASVSSSINLDKLLWPPAMVTMIKSSIHVKLSNQCWTHGEHKDP